jgi:hypothetical protein
MRVLDYRQQPRWDASVSCMPRLEKYHEGQQSRAPGRRCSAPPFATRETRRVVGCAVSALRTHT